MINIQLNNGQIWEANNSSMEIVNVDRDMGQVEVRISGSLSKETFEISDIEMSFNNAQAKLICS